MGKKVTLNVKSSLRFCLLFAWTLFFVGADATILKQKKDM